MAIEVAISQIASDNTSAALEILQRAGAVFSRLRAAHQTEPEDLRQAQLTVLETCKALVCAQPDMGPILRLASAAVSAAQTATSARDALESTENEALRFVQTAARAARAAASQAASLIRNGSTVLTHSRSSTVLAAFTEARRTGTDFCVIATESRPALEGRDLADQLSRQGTHVTLIADAAASLLMHKVDMVLVGADKITPMNVVNKIGTEMIALAARERGLPAYAVCDTSKFIAAEYNIQSHRESGGADELWKDVSNGVTIVNRYFEAVPLAYFSKIIMEDGALTVEDTARRAQRASINKAMLDAVDGLHEEIR